MALLALDLFALVLLETIPKVTLMSKFWNEQIIARYKNLGIKFVTFSTTISRLPKLYFASLSSIHEQMALGDHKL